MIYLVRFSQRVLSSAVPAEALNLPQFSSGLFHQDKHMKVGLLRLWRKSKHTLNALGSYGRIMLYITWYLAGDALKLCIFFAHIK